jgi:hypothetical protein
MPVEAFIETGERTALSYLVKPFTDQFVRVPGGVRPSAIHRWFSRSAVAS